MAQSSLQTHKIHAFLKYGRQDPDGLDPYWLLTSMYLNGVDGQQDYSVETEIDGEPWEITFGYRKTGIAPRDQDSFESRFYGWMVHGEGPGQAKAKFDVEPRFPEMRHHESGDRLSFPWEHLDQTHGLKVEAEGSNVAWRRYPKLLREFVEVLGDDLGFRVDRSYFRQPIVEGGTAASNVVAIERYLRINRDFGQKLCQTGNVIDKCTMYLSSQEGTSGQYKWNNEGAFGQRHAFDFAPDDADLLIPGHDVGKQVKCYLLKDPDSVDEDDPTYHSKLEVKTNNELNGGSPIAWADMTGTVRELDEQAINILDWGDIPLDPEVPVDGPTVYIGDDHYAPVRRDAEVPIYADPTPELEARNEHLFVTAMRDLTDADVDVLETLADGGISMHYDEIADEADRAVSTIYRCFGRLQAVLENENGTLSFANQQIAEDLQAIVKATERQVQSAADRIAEIYNVHGRHATSSAFQSWLAKYGAELTEADYGDQVIRFDTVLSRMRGSSYPRLQDVLEAGVQAWRDDGRDGIRIREFEVRWEDAYSGRSRGYVKNLLE